MQAPPLSTDFWLNTDTPYTLDGLRGRVVVIEAFQMLCPGCVSQGLPQAQRISTTFSSQDVFVMGLHTVFEHHDAQGSQAALEAFVHEYGYAFPIAKDQASPDGLPKTMSDYRMRGTPTINLIDRNGVLVQQHFGHVPDLLLGAEIQQLLNSPSHLTTQQQPEPAKPCDANGCQIS